MTQIQMLEWKQHINVTKENYMLVKQNIRALTVEHQTL